MVSKCDLCNKSFARQKELGRHVRMYMKTRDMNVEFLKTFYEKIHTYKSLHTRSNDRQCTKNHHEEGLHDQHDQVCIQ